MRKQIALDLLKEHLRLENKSDSTVRNYVSSVDKFLQFSLENKYDNLIEYIKGFILHLKDIKKVESSSINLKTAAIRYFCLHILKKQISFEEIPRMKQIKKLPEFFNSDEVSKILNQTVNLKHKLLLSFAYGCGLRLSEIVSLRVSNFFDDWSKLRILGKGQKERIIPVDDSMSLLCKSIYKNSNLEDFLFKGQEKDHLTKRSAQKVLWNACNCSGGQI